MACKGKGGKKAGEDREAVIQISPFEAQGEASYFCVRRPKTTRRHRGNNCLVRHT